MSARLLVLMFIAPCASLTLDAKPPNLIQKQDTCTLTYAAHSGFGNQLYGALGAGYIAKVTGCKLVMPPVLNHGDTNYGKRGECKKGIEKEKTLLNQVAPYYKRSNLTWNKIYKLNTKIASEEPLKADPRSLHFLPMTCKLWEEMGQDEAKFGKYLRDYIQKTDPTGSYTMGSGYNTFAPHLEFDELFEGASANMEQAVSDAQDSIAQIAKAEKGDYACVHLRSRDIAMIQELDDKPLKEWVDENLERVGRKPLLVISANLQKNVHKTMEKICSRQETECIDGNAVFHSKTSAGSLILDKDYGFDQGKGLKFNKRLLMELATCAMASDVYLPNSQKKIIKGQEQSAKHANLFQSTMSDVIATMAQSSKMKASIQLKEKK
eukprot:gnl/MRDRNA2_/MRDRNA2_74597_c0_seq2.p1 gnl/MRDRNA2_/MRDRNA2_74597_c0~~gnl/MRDRNA2_/MRDRNA2_74597_c0_seq2.p1  ORF type:complete len:379 (+),score=99.81 gnl/MRDRNA2_/MRDRNA2_74597_c0_seq2:96-1232(+)